MQLLCGCSVHFESETFSFLLHFEKVPSAISDEYSLNRSPKRFGYHIGSEILKHCLRAMHMESTLFTHWSQPVLLITCPPAHCSVTLCCSGWSFMNLVVSSDFLFWLLQEIVTENNQIHIKTSRWRRLIKVISYEVKWNCPTPLRKVYPSLRLTTWLAQIKTPSDECMKIHSPIHTSEVKKQKTLVTENDEADSGMTMNIVSCFCFYLSMRECE